MKKGFIKVGKNNQLYFPSHHTAMAIAYTILRKEYKCEECGSIKNIDVHHIDGDRNNNVPENLELLCRSCHVKKHINNG